MLREMAGGGGRGWICSAVLGFADNVIAEVSSAHGEARNYDASGGVQVRCGAVQNVSCHAGV